MPRPKGSKNKPKEGKSKAPKAPKASKAAPKGKEPRAKFEAPMNTKTGAKGAAAAGGAPAGEAVKPSETRRMTPGSTLKSLLSTCRGLKGNMDELNGKLREEIGYAKDKKNLNTGVFGLLRKLDRMEPEKAADFMDTLDYYIDASGIGAKIGAVARLPLGDQPEPPGGGRVTDEVHEDDGEEDSEAAEAVQAAEAAEAAANGNGTAQEANGEPGAEPVSQPAAEPPNVARPRFGQRDQPQSQSAKADEIARAAGTKH